MDQVIVVKMRIIVVVSVRFYVKMASLFNFGTFDCYVLVFKISLACDTTIQKFYNLPLYY